MKFLSFGNKNRNFKKLINSCIATIHTYEPENSITPSCEPDLISCIKTIVSQSQDNPSTWDDKEVDYIKIANALICNAAFDLLASGRYHLSRGVLNPMSCASNLFAVYNKALDYAITIHQIDSQTKEEQLKLLHKQIAAI